ncbi:hypothetical protein EHM76_00880 [bacterium]|nr:MAG: hypothetical protein EHM76_00880 [bacterium]
MLSLIYRETAQYRKSTGVFIHLLEERTVLLSGDLKVALLSKKLCFIKLSAKLRNIPGEGAFPLVSTGQIDMLVEPSA